MPSIAPCGPLVLDELVEQLPLLPLTLVEELGVFASDELLLQLNAFATFGVNVEGKIIANILAVEMAIAINVVTLFIHVMAPSHVYMHSVKLY
jgi:hypothetical protein